MTQNFQTYLTQALHDLKDRHLRRNLTNYIGTSPTELTHANQTLISFADNDYLNLSNHPAIKQAAAQALEQYGMGVRASRFVCGNHPLYEQLETTLAAHCQTEAALVFGSGYLTNLGVITSLCQKPDLILADKYVHACMIDGALLSNATLLRFKHNDLAHCQKLLQQHRQQYRHCFILTETIFSMDGDLAPLEDLLNLAKQYDALMISDDAHGLYQTQHAPTPKHHIRIGTFSKSLGSYGGYVCASALIIEYLKNTARPAIYSTALPAPLLAATLRALQFIKDEPAYCARPIDHAQYFCQLMDLPITQSAIVPYIVKDEEKALALSAFLQTQGFFVPAIRPPTIPKHTSRLRFSFSASHQNSDIDRLVRALRSFIYY